MFFTQQVFARPQSCLLFFTLFLDRSLSIINVTWNFSSQRSWGCCFGTIIILHWLYGRPGNMQESWPDGRNKTVNCDWLHSVGRREWALLSKSCLWTGCGNMVLKKTFVLIFLSRNKQNIRAWGNKCSVRW